VFTDETMAHTGHGGVPSKVTDEQADAGQGMSAQDAALEQQALAELEEALTGNSGESMASELARRHIVTELSDEGLMIELFDLDEEPLFGAGGSDPEPVMQELVTMIAGAFGLVKNGIALEGHVAVQPVVIAHNTAWELSGDRASRVREMLEAEGIAQERMRRVTGHANREPVVQNPMAVRNNRIELILLRTKR